MVSSHHAHPNTEIRLEAKYGTIDEASNAEVIGSSEDPYEVEVALAHTVIALDKHHASVG